MITYKTYGIHFFLKLFRLQGSVFPKALAVAVPCALISAGLKWVAWGQPAEPLSVDSHTDGVDPHAPAVEEHYMEHHNATEVPEHTARGFDPHHHALDFLREQNGKGMLLNATPWNAFTIMIGFLIVFRTNQAYGRWYEGSAVTRHMRAEWFDACSSLVAYTRTAKADAEVVSRFQHTIVRLFSILHAMSMADIQDCSTSDVVTDIRALQLELIDPMGIDEPSLLAIKQSSCRVELVFHWIQNLMMQNMTNGGALSNTPPPILTRAWQQVADGMVKFQEAIKISTVPFPFPYAQICDCLLILHWLLVPMVVASWCRTAWWAAAFTFTQVFVFWALDFIAVEIENPFGMDANDLDAQDMHLEFNQHLLLLLSCTASETPSLSTSACMDLNPPETPMEMDKRFSKCMYEVWEAEDSEPPVRRFGRRRTRRGVVSEGLSSRTMRSVSYAVSGTPTASRWQRSQKKEVSQTSTQREGQVSSVAPVSLSSETVAPTVEQSARICCEDEERCCR